MILKYKNYEGALIYAQQIEGDKFKFILKDIDGIRIDFFANMSDIRIKDCIRNIEILSEVKRLEENNE